MLGTIVNCAAIILGGALGLVLKGGLSKKISDTIMNGLALCIVYIGISGALKRDNDLVVIICMALGALIGELFDIDKLLQRLGDSIEARFKGGSNKISEGFVSASLIYCVGAMAIMGSLQSGLTGNHEILYSKSIIDGVSAIIFASSLGLGVMLSSISVLLYQGLITLCASSLKTLLVGSVVANMTAVGSLLILALGLNMLKITKIKVANLLPAIFLPIIYELIRLVF